MQNENKFYELEQVIIYIDIEYFEIEKGFCINEYKENGGSIKLIKNKDQSGSITMFLNPKCSEMVIFDDISYSTPEACKAGFIIEQKTRIFPEDCKLNFVIKEKKGENAKTLYKVDDVVLKSIKQTKESKYTKLEFKFPRPEKT